MSYSERLSNPLWQKKSAEIKIRDDWTCQICLSKKLNLQVHHIEYNGSPWQADDAHLITVCYKCHEDIHGKKKVYIRPQDVTGEIVPRPEKLTRITDRINFLMEQFKNHTDIDFLLIEIRDLNELKVEIVKELGFTPVV